MSYAEFGLPESELYTILKTHVNKYIVVYNLRRVMNVNNDLACIEHRIKRVAFLYEQKFNKNATIKMSDIVIPGDYKFDFETSRLAEIIEVENEMS